MTFTEIRDYTKLSQEDFAKRYSIPLSSLKSWESGTKTPPESMVNFIKLKVAKDYPDIRYLLVK